EDDGPGIAADTLPRIFDPFFSTKQRGTGLGLAVTQQIIQEHGGELRCQSTPGVGTRFTIVLPRARATRSKEASLGSENASGGAQLAEEPLVGQPALELGVALDS